MIRAHSLRLSACLLALAVVSASGAGMAQNAPVAPMVENIRVDYARVLNVEPVYETLRATRAEKVCDQPAQPKPQPKDEEGRLARMWDSVKGVFTDDDKPKQAAPAAPRCRTVPVAKEFQRPIAYDVDYMYKGMKYRSRLPEDPGTRLRIRISVMPYEAAPVALP